MNGIPQFLAMILAIDHESNLKLRGVENACQGGGINVTTKGQGEIASVFLSSGKIKPTEGRGLGVNDIAITLERPSIFQQKLRG